VGLAAWLVASYTLGARVIRDQYRQDTSENGCPMAVYALGWLVAPVWAPLYGVGRVLTAGAKARPPA